MLDAGEMSIRFYSYEARETARIAVNDLSGAIGRVVIGDEKGEVRIGLGEKGLQHRREVCRLVIDDGVDKKFYGIRHCMFPTLALG
jgi:hypothetical protein